MAETKHTPGQWRYVERTKSTHEWLGLSPSGGTTNKFAVHGGPVAGFTVEVCDLYPIELRPGEVVANGRLIAAAPDLLAALKSVLPILEAVRHTAGLGKGQWERAERARAAVAKAEGR